MADFTGTNAKRGLDILIYTSDNKMLAGQRGCTLNRSASLIDVTNKTNDGWVESLTSTKQWSIDCDGVFVYDDAALVELEEAFLNSTVVKITLKDSKGWGYEGNAVITDFPIEAPYDDAATYSLTLTGTGALTKYTAVEL